MSTERHRWQPWTIAFLGATLLGVTVFHLTTTTGSIGSRLFESSVAVTLSILLVGFGVWLYTTQFDEDALTRVAAWCVGATIGIGLLGAWAFLVLTNAGLAPIDAGFIVIVAGAFGGVVGAVIGVYDARQSQLRRSAERARRALDASNDGIAAFDGEGRFALVNDAFAEKYGFDAPDDLLGEPWERIVAEEAIDDIETRIAPAVEATGSWRGEVEARHRDGAAFPVEMSVSAVEDGNTVVVVRDITERHEHEAEVAFRNSLLGAQLEASRDGILILDEDWDVLAFNDRLREILDVPASALEGDDVDVVEVVAERMGDPAALRERVEHFEHSPFETDSQQIPMEDGRIVERFSAPVEDGETYYGRVFTFRDVTDRLHYERTIEALHGASQRLTYAESVHEVAEVAVEVARTVFEKPLSGVWLYDEATGELHPESVTARTESTLLEAGFDDVPPAGDDALGMSAFREGRITVVDDYAEATGPEFPDLDLGTIVLVPLGDHGVFELGQREATGLSDADLQLVGILQRHVEAALDRLERQRELAQREQRLRTIVENVPMVLFAFGEDGVFTLSEGVGLERIGFEPGEVEGDTIEEVFAPAPPILELCHRALEGEAVARTVDFGGRTFETWLDPIVEDGEVRQVIGTAVDVTDRVRYERAIEALHTATREMMTADDPTAVAEVVTAAAREAIALPMTGVWLADDDGEHLEPASLTLAARQLIEDPPTFGPDRGIAWRAFESGETLLFDDVRDDPDVLSPETPMRSELIAPIGRFGVLTSGSTGVATFDENDVALAELLAENAAVAIDRTEREQRLSRQADQIEFFNSILRHDVLNGMTVIRSRAEFIATEVDGELAEYARTIVEWCDDVVDIIGRVRRVLETLTRETAPSLEPIDLAATLEAEVDRIRKTYPDVEFAVDVPSRLSVRADELLADVLGNVVTNAIEHNDTAGLVVEVEAEATDGDVLIRIGDNGAGIADDRKEAVFRRGETGHAKATGSGFGLFFVDAMVETYGGSIRVEDNDLGGATFAVRLDAAGEAGVE